ncbi:MAG: aminotransferase class I/II-fold pyridoxal phosphate-dependent enzyme [Methylobacter sp.]
MNHGGNIYRFAEKLGCLPEQVLDFSANINPMQAVDLSSLVNVQLTPYADPEYGLLKQAIGRRYSMPDGVDMELFNGASAAIFALLRSLQPEHLVLYTPLYGEYQHIAEALGCTVQQVNRYQQLTADIPRGSTVIFVNPSTPDGRMYDMAELLEKWQAADCTIVIDESFLDFCSGDSVTGRIPDYDKLYLIKSLSKFYGCAGIRVGFILAATKAIAKLRRLEPAWKLSSLDMAYMLQALDNTAFIEQTREQTVRWRALLQQVLQDSGLFEAIYPSQANFLLARLANNRETSAAAHDGYWLQSQLQPARILIRVCDNFAGLDEFHVRFAVKDEQAIARLARSFVELKN